MPRFGMSLAITNRVRASGEVGFPFNRRRNRMSLGFFSDLVETRSEVFSSDTFEKRSSQMKRVLLAGLALMLSLIAFSAQAQVTSGGVKGVVVDQNGAAVANASVTITNKL